MNVEPFLFDLSKRGVVAFVQTLSLALARRHASRVLAMSSAFPDFRFFADFPSKA